MKKVINFTRLRYIMYAVSLVFIIGGIIGTVARGGFNLGIDFQAGINEQVQITASNADIQTVRDALSGISGTNIQSIGGPDERTFSIQVKEQGTQADFSAQMSAQVKTALENVFGAGNVVVQSSDYVGPRFSSTLAGQSVLMTTLALILILVYIWFRFKIAYAVSAIIALLHDVTFMIGIIGTFQIEVSTATIAAVLTIIGYSLNDTIVVFDRIRENVHILRESEFEDIINTSITQSLSRTLMTSLTTLIAVIAIFIFATGTVQNFAMNLIIGIVVGTYSSIFIASPILLAWQNARYKRAKAADFKRYGERVSAVRRDSSAGAAAAAGNTPGRRHCARRTYRHQCCRQGFETAEQNKKAEEKKVDRSKKKSIDNFVLT